MSGVLFNIVEYAGQVIEALTPASPGAGELRASYVRVAHRKVPTNASGDRTFWFDLANTAFEQTSTHATGLWTRARVTVPLHLRIAGFGPDDYLGIERMAHDVLQVITAINTDSLWPANTVRVHVDAQPSFDRTDQDAVAVIPISIEFEEV